MHQSLLKGWKTHTELQKSTFHFVHSNFFTQYEKNTFFFIKRLKLFTEYKTRDWVVQSRADLKFDTDWLFLMCDWLLFWQQECFYSDGSLNTTRIKKTQASVFLLFWGIFRCFYISACFCVSVVVMVRLVVFCVFRLTFLQFVFKSPLNTCRH